MSQYEPKNHLYLRSELRDIIAAVQLASASSLRGAADAYSDAYAQGFDDALRSISVALGLLFEPSPMIRVDAPDPRPVWPSSGRAQIEADASYWYQEKPVRRGA